MLLNLFPYLDLNYMHISFAFYYLSTSIFILSLSIIISVTSLWVSIIWLSLGVFIEFLFSEVFYVTFYYFKGFYFFTLKLVNWDRFFSDSAFGLGGLTLYLLTYLFYLTLSITLSSRAYLIPSVICCYLFWGVTFIYGGVGSS